MRGRFAHFTYAGKGIKNSHWQAVPLNESVGYDPAVRDYLKPCPEARDPNGHELALP